MRPIGIIPFWLFMQEEKPNYTLRKQQLKEAIQKYLEADLDIDLEWIIEYNKYIK